MRTLLFFSFFLLSCACRTASVAAADAGACVCPAPAEVAVVPDAVKPVQRQEPTTESPHVHPLAVCPAEGKLPLEVAQEAYDNGEYEKALSCAAQAAALTPGDVVAHTERANALGQLKRMDEAALAYARALAIDPDSLDALAGAAHFYIVVQPSSRDMDELGSNYAERGFDLARQQKDEEFSLHFARLSAMGFNDIGQSEDALDRADWVLAREKNDPEALYERALALFELSRFKDARAVFTKLLNDKERAAWAHHHLGLILEREGKDTEADQHFVKARELDPDAFPEPVLISADEFKKQMKDTIAALPEDMRKDLKGIRVAMEDLPKDEDLNGDPPLSPTILGLFRGTPLSEDCVPEPGAKPNEPCRSIAIYRKNLARAVTTRDELNEQIRVTLLHEIGHLRGEDDSELAARGLE